MHRHVDDDDDDDGDNEGGAAYLDADAVVMRGLRRAAFVQVLRVRYRNFLHAYFVIWHAFTQHWRRAFRFQ